MDFFDPFELQFSSPSSEKSLIGNKRIRNESSTSSVFSDCSVTDEDDDDSLIDRENDFSLIQPHKKRIRISNRLYGENIFLNIHFPDLSDEPKLPPPIFNLESPNLMFRIDFRENSEFLIGTGEECGVRIPMDRFGETLVSPHHAKLIYNPISGIVSIVPLSRKRVVWVNNMSYLQEYEISHNENNPNNDECYRRISIHDGDVISVGKRRFRFKFVEDVDRFLEPSSIPPPNFSSPGNNNNYTRNFQPNRRFHRKVMNDERDEEEEEMLEFLRLEDEKLGKFQEKEKTELNRAFDRVEDLKQEDKEVGTNNLDFLLDLMIDEDEDEEERRKNRNQNQNYVEDEEEEEDYYGNSFPNNISQGNNNNRGGSSSSSGVSNLVFERGGKKRKRRDDDDDRYRF